MKTYSIIVRSLYNGSTRIMTTTACNAVAAVTKILKEHPGFVSVGFSY